MDFYAYDDFEELTARAVLLGKDLPAPFRRLLRRLADCETADAGVLYDQQRRGATYKQLGYIAYLACPTTRNTSGIGSPSRSR